MSENILNNLPKTEEEFIELLDDYNYAYREALETTPEGRVAISDSVYDALTVIFKEQHPESNWFENVEEEQNIEGAEDVEHKVAMLSTDKAYTIDELKKWMTRIEKNTGHNKNLINIRITPKLDGLAGKDEGNVFSTRGNGLRGSKINYAFERGVKPIGGRNQGLGEIIIKQSYFEDKLKDKFEHPRNVAVGIIKADTLKEHSLEALDNEAVHFVPYSQLPSWEGDFDTLLKELDDICDKLKEQTDYLIDGFVIETTSQEIKEKMGATQHHYRWQIALKKKGEVAYPYITDAIIQIGRTGAATPVFYVEPTLLSGAVIRRVTAHNIRFVTHNNIGIGSQIEMVRSGEVIPKIENVIKPSKEPCTFSHCPSCQTELVFDENEVSLLCPNKENCKDQVIGQILHFFTTIDNCDGFGRKTIEILYENNIKSLKDIYDLDEQTLHSFGFGKGISANLKKALKESQENKVEDWRLLASFGIRNLGKGDSKKLLRHFTISSLNEVTKENIIEIEGFGEKTSESIANEIQEQWPVISFMLEKGFNIKETPKNSARQMNVFSGKNILLTGTMIEPENNGVPYKRQELEALLEDLGAKIQKQISSTTDILIYGDKAGSKLKKAEEMRNIHILDEKSFWEKHRDDIKRENS